MPDTIRQHLEAIRDRHALENVGSDSHLCIWCGCADYPCHDRADAVAALDLLNNAQTQEGGPWNTCRLVPDPESSDA